MRLESGFGSNPGFVTCFKIAHRSSRSKKVTYARVVIVEMFHLITVGNSHQIILKLWEPNVRCNPNFANGNI